ncbi:hypothetical protein Phi19:2_gp085 [Cellulophaga phage phi19:2]|uniref:Uncharacterized protein n=3 Tax=Cellulophaga phage phiST TaxID=756282 RepID=M4T1Q4_9CAUD|nr:hypothetical protein CGPG_00025 [Cellulophaga phage phiST]AGH56724.1 hypothetical protein CGPG_00025 [Cellulophaga phage phiST]AGO47224.1 hypothetical protein PhiST_gp085 [Cellulophaga phage phiST]AGO48720.1 hypothetical protein Phi19:2_gp085 [Cellulophaga phage phi19:2]AGO49090.1 hypothetical protein Phi13:1_gp079 [Cellulophaga phage phi13:1]
MASVQKANKANAKPKTRKRFLDVDPFQSKFGPISEKAIFDVFLTKFNKKPESLVNYSFSDCVNALRELELKEQEAFDEINEITFEN